MKKTPILISIIIFQFLIFNIVSCKTKKEIASSNKTESTQQTTNSSQPKTEEINLVQNSTKTKQAISKNDSLFVTIERTVCFGKCPAYKASIYTKGYIIFDGKMNVDKIGRFSTQLSKEELESLKQKINTINYFDLNDKYDGPVTDLPSVITSVALNGYRKSITARYEVPAELKGFQNFIDKLFIDKNWIFLGDQENK